MTHATECRVRKIESAERGDIFEMTGEWFQRCAQCGERRSIRDHTVTLRMSDRLRPTIRASILCDTCGAHYYVTEGRVEW